MNLCITCLELILYKFVFQLDAERRANKELQNEIQKLKEAYKDLENKSAQVIFWLISAALGFSYWVVLSKSVYGN